MTDFLTLYGSLPVEVSYDLSKTPVFQFYNNPINYIEHCLQLIVDDKTENINLIEFDNAVFFAKVTDQLAFVKCLLNTYDKCTNEFADLIQQCQSIKEFGILYNQFHAKTQRIKRCLKDVDQNYLERMKNYMFCNNVVNRELYELLNKILSTEEVSYLTVVPLFKLKQYYDKFYDTVNNKFLVNIGSNETFIKSLITFIDQSVKSKTDLEKVDELIKLATNFSERDLFNMYYTKFLENRILEKDADLECEKRLLTQFKTPDDNRYVKDVEYKIEDVEISKKLMDTYMKMKITKQTDTYTNLNIEEIDRSKLFVKLMRFYAWDDAKISDVHEYTVPKEIECYIIFYKKMFEHIYPNRNINFNFNIGTAQITMNLNGKPVQFQVTTSQMFVLLQFNSKAETTPLEIAANLNMSLSTVGQILNGFLRIKLLVRDEQINSTNVKPEDCLIRINSNFVINNPNCNKVSLVNLLKTAQTHVSDKKVVEQFMIGRENILAAKIVRVLKILQTVPQDCLQAVVEDKLIFKPTNEMFEKCVEKCIDEEYIAKKDNDYVYVTDDVPVDNKDKDKSKEKYTDYSDEEEIEVESVLNSA